MDNVAFLKAKSALELNKTPIFQEAVKSIQEDLFLDFVECDDPEHLPIIQSNVHALQSIVDRLNSYIEESERIKLEQGNDFQ